jgi:hypothetical protein
VPHSNLKHISALENLDDDDHDDDDDDNDNDIIINRAWKLYEKI